MKIVALDINNLKEVILFQEKNFKIIANFKIDVSDRLLKEIDIKIENPSPKQRYEYISGNFCLNKIHRNLDIHVVELHIREKNDANTDATPIIPKPDTKVVLKNGTTLVVSPIFYGATEAVKECTYSIFEGQPETKDGAIIVSI